MSFKIGLCSLIILALLPITCPAKEKQTITVNCNSLWMPDTHGASCRHVDGQGNVAAFVCKDCVGDSVGINCNGVVVGDKGVHLVDTKLPSTHCIGGYYKTKMSDKGGTSYDGTVCLIDNSNDHLVFCHGRGYIEPKKTCNKCDGVPLIP